MAEARIVVFGASGHTGRFVIRELQRRGRAPVVAGRDGEKVRAVAAQFGLEWRVARIEDPASLDDAVESAAAIINCAGPFLDTAPAVIEAALRARAHYLDVTAEQQATLAAFDRYGDAARAAGVVVVPAMAFYGGLGDLLTTAVLGDWISVDDIQLAIALDSWKPTLGTRLTGQRNTARRLVVADGKLDALPNPAPTRRWEFPAPFGVQDVVGLPYSETILMSRHIKARAVTVYLNLVPLRELRNPDTPPPSPADDSGRSTQTFLIDVVVRRGLGTRRGTARGRDIYAMTAPLVVEAAERILDGRIARLGVAAPGEVFDSRDFLTALAPEPLEVSLSDS
jgi:hypothetical protein